MAWLLVPGHHAVTAALVVSGVAGSMHHARFHRFFSEARWSVDELGRILFQHILAHVDPQAPVCVAIDDTLAKKKGPSIFGLGNHLDAVRSSRCHRIFAFGHVWVVLAVVVRFPFSKRPWALPVLFRFYRNEKENARNGAPHHKKTELAHEMLQILAGWLDGRRCQAAMDQAYCCGTVIHGLPPNIVVFGAMRNDAALFDPPAPPQGKRRGRPRRHGKRLPSPADIAADTATPWERATADMYREQRTVEYKSFLAQWPSACADQLLRIVVVAVNTGEIPCRVYFCTDPTVLPIYLLETYACRWSIEVTFFDLKQFMGFADSQARTRLAVLRTAPFVGLLYTLVVLWYADIGHTSPFAVIPFRPWYTTKTGPSFPDMLGAAQRAVAHAGLFDVAHSTNNLQNYRAGPRRLDRRAG
jgi:hypothetical protein